MPIHPRFSLFPLDCRTEVNLNEPGPVPGHEAGEGVIVNLAELVLHFVAQDQQEPLQSKQTRGRAQASHDGGVVRRWWTLNAKRYNPNQTLHFGFVFQMRP